MRLNILLAALLTAALPNVQTSADPGSHIAPAHGNSIKRTIAAGTLGGVLPRRFAFTPLGRNLQKIGLSLESLASAPEAVRLPAIEAKLVVEADLLSVDPPETVAALYDYTSRVDAVLEVAEAIGSYPRVQHLIERKKDARLKLFAAQKALIQRAVDLYVKSEGRVQGRTHFMTLPEGKVAIKLHPNEKEAAQMGLSRQLLGPSIPIPISAGTYPLTQPLQINGLQHEALFYLMPAGEPSSDYARYLDEKLPRAMSRKEKAQAIDGAFQRSMVHLGSLLKHGLFHESLLPLSHSEAHWSWDHWRYTEPIAGGRRFGPTSIHNWRSATSYPNLRYSGAADFEHLSNIEDFSFKDRDYYSVSVGQNFAEAIISLSNSAKNNRLGLWKTIAIAARGIETYLASLGSPARVGLHEKLLIASFLWRHRIFIRIAEALSQKRTDWINLRLSSGSFGSPFTQEIAQGEALVMPGWVVDPLANAVLRILNDLRKRNPSHWNQLVNRPHDMTIFQSMWPFPENRGSIIAGVIVFAAFLIFNPWKSGSPHQLVLTLVLGFGSIFFLQPYLFAFRKILSAPAYLARAVAAGIDHLSGIHRR